MLENALNNPALNDAEKRTVQQQAQIKGIGAALGLLGGLLQAARERYRALDAKIEREEQKEEAAWEAWKSRSQTLAAQRYQQEIIEIAQHGDHIGDKVNRAKCVCDHAGGKQARIPGRAQVAVSQVKRVSFVSETVGGILQRFHRKFNPVLLQSRLQAAVGMGQAPGGACAQNEHGSAR